jgi:adenylate cyclase
VNLPIRNRLGGRGSSVGHAGGVDDDPVLPGPDELERSGVFDPATPDAADRLELIRYAMARGATLEDIAAATNLGELALDLNLRPRGASSLAEVVEAAGMEWARANRLLTALGFPLDADQRLTADEAATIRLLGAASGDLLGEDATVQVARVAGNAMARVAEVLVGAFRLQFELPRRAAGTRDSDVVKEYADLAQTLLPAFVRTLDVLLRRQIVAVAERMWSTDEERSVVTLPRTVGFADLVGYTEAAASMSVRELAAVLAEFDERTANVVLRGNGQIVKTIGDEAMFVTEDAADACGIALDLVDEFGHGRLPPVRVGLAAGEVVSVFGDVYGPDVNLAARLVAIAEPSSVVASERVRAESGDGFQFERLPPLTLKGLPTVVFAYHLHR